MTLPNGIPLILFLFRGSSLFGSFLLITVDQNLKNGNDAVATKA